MPARPAPSSTTASSPCFFVWIPKQGSAAACWLVVRAVLLHNAVQTVKIGVIGKSTLAVIKAQKRTAAVRQDKISVCFPVLRAEIRQELRREKRRCSPFSMILEISTETFRLSPHEDKRPSGSYRNTPEIQKCPKTRRVIFPSVSPFFFTLPIMEFRVFWVLVSLTISVTVSTEYISFLAFPLAVVSSSTRVGVLNHII